MKRLLWILFLLFIATISANAQVQMELTYQSGNYKVLQASGLNTATAVRILNGGNQVIVRSSNGDFTWFKNSTTKAPDEYLSEEGSKRGKPDYDYVKMFIFPETNTKILCVYDKITDQDAYIMLLIAE